MVLQLEEVDEKTEKTPGEAAGSPNEPGKDPTPAPTIPKGTGLSAENNWGQKASLSEVTPPADLEPPGPDEKIAKLGWIRVDGQRVPYSPYGSTPRGRVRTRTVKARSVAQGGGAQGEAATARRLAPGEQKAPADVAGLYSALDDAHNREVELMKEIRRRHPETKYGTPIHPKELGSGQLQRATVLHGKASIQGLIESACGFFSGLLDDESLIPDSEALEEAADKISEASRYYGLEASPKSQATWAAVIAVGACFLPIILAGARKLWETIFGAQNAEEEPPVLEEREPA